MKAREAISLEVPSFFLESTRTPVSVSSSCTRVIVAQSSQAHAHQLVETLWLIKDVQTRSNNAYLT
jgi:hypothetical protein